MERQDEAEPLEQFNHYTHEPLATAPIRLGPYSTEEDPQRISGFSALDDFYDPTIYDRNSSDPESEIEFTMVVIERKIKVVTEQHNIDKPAQMEGFPMKEWTIEIYVLDQDGKEHPATCFTKVVYNLHPSFEQPTQTYTEPPFKCTNEGWGEFEMTIDMYTTEKGGKTSIPHDLNFAKPTYENVHKVLFKNPSMALQAILRETGPVPTDEERKIKKVDAGPKNKKRVYDIEKMADALPQCEEDDLLQIIQMIHDGKTDNTFVSNNIDAGEFSVDLYTLPEDILVQLWELLVRRGLIN